MRLSRSALILGCAALITTLATPASAGSGTVGTHHRSGGSGGSSESVSVYWLMPNGGTATNVTWPQTYHATPQCGTGTYQVDVYPKDKVPALIADGLLQYGEDWTVVKSWSFVAQVACEPAAVPAPTQGEASAPAAPPAETLAPLPAPSQTAEAGANSSSGAGATAGAASGGAGTGGSTGATGGQPVVELAEVLTAVTPKATVVTLPTKPGSAPAAQPVVAAALYAG